MMPVILKSAVALAAAAGLAYTASDDVELSPAYGEGHVLTLTQSVVADHAEALFQRADRNQDGVLNVDEYTALQVISAELAALNGFIVIETGGEPATVAIPGGQRGSLGEFEQVRVAAVSRNAFYHQSGDDGQMDEAEFSSVIRALFDATDFNGDGTLKRAELGAFAQRQAFVATEA